MTPWQDIGIFQMMTLCLEISSVLAAAAIQTDYSFVQRIQSRDICNGIGIVCLLGKVTSSLETQEKISVSTRPYCSQRQCDQFKSLDNARKNKCM